MSGFYSTIARYYDAENSDKSDDLAFYSALAAEHGGPLLEIGCGTGRVLLHLAQEGHNAHGIDKDGAMLERAQHKRAALPPDLRENIVLYQGDVLRTDEIHERYKLILLSYNMLTHFQQQEQQSALLKRLRAWLRDDGLLVIDLPNPAPVFASADSDALTLERTFIEPESGHLVMQQSVSTLDRARQLLHVTWVYDEISADGTLKRTFAPVVFRYYFLAELRLLLQAAGFAVDTVYGDCDGGDYDETSERLIVLAAPVQG
ncbi:MAG: class I SAM-dependent methyltransferase [Chloroflexi bacterium]|nr:class I SAM-dependent methyltransferase [Chloroflexota bacterium]